MRSEGSGTVKPRDRNGFGLTRFFGFRGVCGGRGTNPHTAGAVAVIVRVGGSGFEPIAYLLVGLPFIFFVLSLREFFRSPLNSRTPTM